MSRSRTTFVLVLGIVAACLILTLACLKWTSTPFVYMASVWGAGACVGMWLVASTPKQKVVCLNVAYATFLLGGIEAWLAWKPDPDRLEYADGYHTDHATLGYAPRPSQSSPARRHHGGELVYDVHYTIDDHGMRVTPAGRPQSEVVVVFGGSFAFGEGLEDEESVPYRVGAASEGRYRVYNFAYHGYGPHQMLAAVQDGLVEGRSEKPVAASIYVSIHPHVARAAGLRSFGRQGPRFVLTESGELERRGRLADAPPRAGPLERQLRRSHVFRWLFGSRFAPTDSDYDLYCALVIRTRDLLAERHPGMEFHVLLWSTSSKFVAKAECLEAKRIPVHRITEIIPDFAARKDDYQLSPHDGHPNARATELVAGYMLEKMLGSR